MSSPTDDDVAASGDDPVVDPAVSYPRGNRLGLRHPRPTVVIVVAVLLVVGGAWAWQSLRRTGYACGVVGYGNAPVAATPEGALEAWFDGTGADEAQAMMSDELGREVDPPSVDDFESVRDDLWIWWVGDAGIGVETDSAHRVAGVNTCDRL